MTDRASESAENACGRKRPAAILSLTMSNEEQQKIPERPGVPKRRYFPALLGIAALAAVVCSAVFGHADPLAGAILLASGVLAALVAVILGIFLRSPRARRFGCLAAGAAVLVTLAGTVVLFSDKNFENRCVDAWKTLVNLSDDVERRVERLEDRFDD